MRVWHTAYSMCPLQPCRAHEALLLLPQFRDTPDAAPPSTMWPFQPSSPAIPSPPRRVTDDTCLAIAAALAPPAHTPLGPPFPEAPPPPPPLTSDDDTQAAAGLAAAAAVTTACHVSAAVGPVLRVLGLARVSPLLGEEGLGALAGALATCLTSLDLSGNAHLEGRGTTTYDMVARRVTLKPRQTAHSLAHGRPSYTTFWHASYTTTRVRFSLIEWSASTHATRGMLHAPLSTPTTCRTHPHSPRHPDPPGPTRTHPDLHAPAQPWPR